MKKAVENTIKNIREMDDYCGLLGFTIAESVGEYDNGYEDIGYGIDSLIDKYPDKVELIEEVVIALSGYGFETLRQKMIENKDYYNTL